MRIGTQGGGAGSDEWGGELSDLDQIQIRTVDQWTNEMIYVKSGYDILEKRSQASFERYI